MSRPTSRNVCCDYSYSSESTVSFTKGLLFLPGSITVIYSGTADQKKLLTWSFRSVIPGLGLAVRVQVKSSMLQTGSCKELEPGGPLAVGASVRIRRWGQLIPPWLIFSLIPPTQLQPWWNVTDLTKGNPDCFTSPQPFTCHLRLNAAAVHTLSSQSLFYKPQPLWDC